MTDIDENFKKEVFEFLTATRNSGIINMFGAPELLRTEFEISKQEARDLFWEWTKTFESED